MVGKRLRELRNAKGLSQQALSENLTVNKESISNYERDKITPSDDVKVEIAKFFNVSVDYLIGAIDTIEPLIRNKPNLPREFKSEWLTDLEIYANSLVYCRELDEKEKEFISKWANLSKGKRQAFLKLIQED